MADTSKINPIRIDKLGEANGVASLDASGKVPQEQLPSYLEKAYTTENLIAGQDITIDEVMPEGGIDSHTLACWHFEDDTLDVVNKLEYKGSLVDTQWKFGTKSASGYLYSSYGNNNLFSPISLQTDWTIDLWKKGNPYSFALGAVWVYQYQGYVNGLGVQFKQGKVYFYNSTSSVAKELDFTFSDDWNHIAVVRKGEVLSLYINGSLLDSISGVTTNFYEYLNVASYSGTCYIDELRISDIARYDKNFTPPTKPYTIATSEPKKYSINYNREYVDGKLATKADLVNGKVPDDQLPATALNAVQKTGDTMTGDLIISDRTVMGQTKNIYEGNRPTKQVYYTPLSIKDKDGKTMGMFRMTQTTNGGYSVLIQCVRNIEGVDRYATFGISIKEDGTITTLIPTPPDSANDTQIPTTAWVRRYGVNKSGDTMTGPLLISKNSTPGSIRIIDVPNGGYGDINIVDNNNIRIASLRATKSEDGNSHSVALAVHKPGEIDAGPTTAINAMIKNDGTLLVSSGITPAEGADDNQIATTSWVRRYGLSKSGGTLTGDLYLQNSQLDFKQTNFTKGDIPTGDLYLGLTRYRDKNDGFLIQDYNYISRTSGNISYIKRLFLNQAGSTSYKDTIKAVVTPEGQANLDLSNNDNVTAPTPQNTDNSSRVATTSWVRGLINSGGVATDFIVDQYYDDNGNWYRVYKSGWVEQGGIFSDTSANPATISLLKAFANTNYTIVTTSIRDGSGGLSARNNVGATGKTTTSFKVYGSGGAEGSGMLPIYWQACGQGA